MNCIIETERLRFRPWADSDGEYVAVIPYTELEGILKENLV